MAFFSDPASGVIHAQSPSTIAPSSQTPPAPKEPSEVEKLALELRRMNENHTNYRTDADRRIGELVQQNNLLRQTYEESLAKSAGVQSKAKAGGNDLDELWNNLLTPAQQVAQTNGQAPQLTPDQVQRIALETMNRAAATSQQINQNTEELERALVQKFEKDHPDLHRYAPQVVTLWRQFAATEPDPIKRFNRVIQTTRELYTANRGVGVSGPDESRPAGSGSNGQQRKQASTLESAMKDELEAEQARHRMTEEIVRDRKRQFQTRTGYPYDQLQKG
jgi:hypothetical protein